MYICTGNKSYRGSGDRQENYNHWGLERALQTLKNGQEGVTERPENGMKDRWKNNKRCCEENLSRVTFPPLHIHSLFQVNRI